MSKAIGFLESFCQAQGIDIAVVYEKSGTSEAFWLWLKHGNCESFPVQCRSRPRIVMSLMLLTMMQGTCISSTQILKQ